MIQGRPAASRPVDERTKHDRLRQMFARRWYSWLAPSHDLLRGADVMLAVYRSRRADATAKR